MLVEGRHQHVAWRGAPLTRTIRVSGGPTLCCQSFGVRGQAPSAVPADSAGSVEAPSASTR
jgi:hypothetical protein